MALPLLIPWNVVGTIWQIFARGDIGLRGRLINGLGINYNYTADPWAAWITIVVMDVWHWTPLVALLCYAGLRAIPAAYYQAASIDGASRWAVFRFIELPKMRGVLLIAVLLRFMDSFMIYTEPFVVTGGGPGSATTFLSIHLAKIAVGQFDLGPAAAISIVYFLIILTLSFVFYNVMTRVGTRGPGMKARTYGLLIYFLFLLLPIYWLFNMSLKTNEEILSGLTLVPAAPTIANYAQIFTDPAWYYGLYQLADLCGINVVLSLGVALPAAYAFSRYRFIGDKHMFFWLLTNRMSPPAVFLLPFFQLYQRSGCSTRTSPSPWRTACSTCRSRSGSWKASCPACRKEIDETAYLDGYTFPRFFIKIFLPLIKSGVGVTAFFCFMFSWVELLLARTLTTVNAKPIAAVMTRTVSAAGMDWGTLAAAGMLTILPGALVIWFVRNYIAKGFALGRV